LVIDPAELGAVAEIVNSAVPSAAPATRLPLSATAHVRSAPAADGVPQLTDVTRTPAVTTGVADVAITPAGS
jgi:hypothetical protein